MPKATIRKADLLEALNRVKHTTSSSKILAFYKCFCFRDGYVSTYNGVAGSCCPLDLNGMEFAVDADKFYRYVSKLYEMIVLDLHEGSGRLYISSGTNQAWLGTIATKGFPVISNAGSVLFTDSHDFKDVMSTLEFSVGKNATKPNLMCIGIRDSYMYASDGDRVTRMKIAKETYGEVCIPTGSVDQLLKLGQPHHCFSILGHDKVPQEFGTVYYPSGTVYITQLLAHRFPFNTVNEMLNVNGEQIVEFPVGIEESIDRIKVLTTDERKEIILEGKEGYINLRAASSEGTGEENVTTAFSLSFKFAINPQLLLDGLQRSHQVDLSNVVGGDNRQIRFVGENDFQHICALMSMNE